MKLSAVQLFEHTYFGPHRGAHNPFGNNSIIQPLLPCCKFVAVIPIRDEIENKNFFLQLKDLIRQVGIRAEEFEVFYSVNNTVADCQNNTRRFRANKIIFAVLNYIAGNTNLLPNIVPDWAIDLIKEARRKQIKIHALDMSSVGLKEKDITKARIAAHNYVQHRLEAAKNKNAVVCTLDSDVKMGSRTFAQLCQQLKAGQDASSIQTLTLPYQWTIGEAPGPHQHLILQQHLRPEQIKRLIFYLGKFNSPESATSWKAYRSEAYGKIDIPEYEDLASVFDELSVAPHELARDLRLYTQYRARPLGVGGLFGTSNMAKTSRAPEVYLVAPNLFRNIFKFNLNAVFMNDLAEEATAKLINYITQELSATEATNLETFIAKAIREDSIRHQCGLVILRDILEVVDKSKLQEQVQQGASILASDIYKAGTFQHDLLERNPGLLLAVMGSCKKYSTRNEVLKDLAKQLPDFVLPFTETPNGLAIARLRGLMSFLHEVSKNRDSYPAAYAFIYLGQRSAERQDSQMVAGF